MKLIDKSLDSARARTASIIKTRFHASYMSDAKWVRLLRALSEIGSTITECRVKLVWDEATRNLRVDENIDFGFDYYAASMEAMVSGSPKGFYEYKEIEWIEFTNNGQDLRKIEDHITSTGMFEIEARPEGVRLYGYKGIEDFNST
jgi:hypothetical protein